VPGALRTAAEAVGGMGLGAFDTLAGILAAFGLRLTERTRGGRGSRGRVTSAPA